MLEGQPWNGRTMREGRGREGEEGRGMEQEGPGASASSEGTHSHHSFSHTLLFTLWPTSGPGPSECFIPSHCHILSKKASLLWIAEVMVSLIRGHVFHPSITRNGLKCRCWLSHTQRRKQATAARWVRGTAQRTPDQASKDHLPHLCYLMLQGETAAIKGACDPQMRQWGKVRRGASAGLMGAKVE